MNDFFLSDERRDDAARLTEPGSGLLERALEAARRKSGAEGRLDLQWEDPQWAPGHAWCRPVTLKTDVRQPHEQLLLVPWLVDERAAKTAPDGVVVGGGAGTFWGRPREHPVHLVRSSGVSFVHWDHGSEFRKAVDILVGWGPQIRITPTSATAVRVAIRGHAIPDGQRDYSFDDLDPIIPRRRPRVTGAPKGDEAESDETHQHATAEPPRSLPDFLAGMAAELLIDERPFDASVRGHGIELPSATPLTAEWWRPLLREAIRRLVAIDGTVFVPLLDRANWQVEHAHSQFARQVHRLAMRAVPYRLRRTNLGEGLGVYLGSAVSSAVESVFAGRNSSFAAGDSTITPINTVAAIERTRLHTFLGPAGLEEYYGRLDLRILPDGWNGELCPVETPESEKIGLVRYRAIAQHLEPAMSATAGPSVPSEPFGVHALGEFGVGAALVPAVDHNDPTRTSIAAKMMRQAVRMPGAEPPRVRTGAEEWIAEHAGVARAPISGPVTRVSPGLIEIDQRSVVAFGPAEHDGLGRDGRWVTRVDEGAWVYKGEIIAHAPDVRLEERGPTLHPCLALGVDALVALLPWHGWNFEDGIVVSRSFSRRLASEHARRISVPLGAGAIVEDLLPSEQLGGAHVAAGTELFAVSRDGGDRRVFRMPEDGYVPGRVRPGTGERATEDLVGVDRTRGSADLDIVVQRSLAVGDKLATRHGGKGVVTRIEPDAAMPHLDGKPVEVLLNPVGVIRRLTIGTYVELAEGLASYLGDETVATTVERGLGRANRLELAARLKILGAPGGRCILTTTGEESDKTVHAVVGILHVLKLDHLAASKAGARADTGASPLTLQPTRASSWGTERRLAAPQRLGEMEVWALQASGADLVVADLLHERGEGDHSLRGTYRDLVPAGLRAVSAHLAMAGCQVQALLTPLGGSPRWADITFTPSTPLNQVTDLREVYIGDAAIPPGLESFSWTSIDSSIGDPRQARDRARAIVDEMLDRYSPNAAGEGNVVLPSEGVHRGHWALPLSLPARHPWGLGALNWIAIPPAHMITAGGGSGAGDSPLRGSIERVIAAELNLRSVEKRPSDYLTKLTAVRDSRIEKLLGTIDRPDAEAVAGRLQGKYGLLRRNLLGASAVRSARAVLVGDPTLDIEQVALPRWMIADLIPPEGEHELDGLADVVLINRQPTLLPNTFIALRFVEGEHDVVAVHPHHVTALAGDFDGDTIAVHRPVSPAARREAWDRRRPAASLRSPAKGDLLAPLSLDIALGAAIATSADGGPAPFVSLTARDHRPHDVANIVHALGTIPIANPELLRRAAERLVSLCGEIDVDSRRATLAVLADFYTLCFRAASTWSPSIIDLTVNGTDFASLPDLDLARQAEVVGSADDLEQLFVTRGRVQLPTTVQQGGHVTGTYLDGITPAHYALAARGALSSLAAKKLVTPAAGALTRALVTVGYEERIGEACALGNGAHNVLDCPGVYACSVAYGPDRETGGAIAVGRRVGILAAMAIGERSTQLALKSIHQRGGAAGALFDVVRQVRNELVLLERIPRGSEVPDDAALKAMLLKRADTVASLLRGKLSVDPVHSLVLLRVHLRTLRRRREGGNQETSRQPRLLSAFSRAVLNGSLAPLTTEALATTFDDAEPADSAQPAPISHFVGLLSGRIGR